MKEYEKLAEEYLRNTRERLPEIDIGAKSGFIAGFIEAREMAAELVYNMKSGRYVGDWIIGDIQKLGEKKI